MNILILNGSGHINGNTAALVGAFTQGAVSKGHSVEMIQVGTKRINGCIACEYCHTKGNGKCVQQDDMILVYDALEKAEMVVFASPVHYWGFSGQLQSVITRFYAPNIPKAKKYALLLSSMSPGVYNGIISQYKDMLGYFGAEDVGIVTACEPENKSPEKLEEARRLGESL